MEDPSTTTTVSEEEPWSTELRDRQLWLAFLAVVSGLVPQLDDHHKRSFGISHHEFTVLIMIADAGHPPIELSAIARRTSSSVSRISHTVRRLERDGFIVLGRSERDARATTAVITDAGSTLLERASREGMAEVRRLVFDPLTCEQKASLTEISLTLLRHWRPDDPRPWLR